MRARSGHHIPLPPGLGCFDAHDCQDPGWPWNPGHARHARPPDAQRGPNKVSGDGLTAHGCTRPVTPSCAVSCPSPLVNLILALGSLDLWDLGPSGCVFFGLYPSVLLSVERGRRGPGGYRHRSMPLSVRSGLAPERGALDVLCPCTVTIPITICACPHPRKADVKDDTSR